MFCPLGSAVSVVVMRQKFTGAHEDRDQACDGHYSATVEPAYDTVGSRFDKVTCAQGKRGSSAPLGVVEVSPVTGVK